MTIVLDKGERRHVKLMIHSCKNENFEIITADYELKKHGSDKTEDSGSGNILENMIDIVIEPKEKAEYTLKVTYRIADEILIESIGIKVI